MGFFENLFTSFEAIVNSVVIQSDYFDIFRYTIVSYFTFRLMWIGYMSQFGRIQEPIKEVTITAIKYLFIMVWAGNYNGYLDLFFNAIDGFKNFVSGDINIYATLDSTVKTGGKLAALLYDKGNMVSGTLASIAVWIAVFFACSAPIFIIMVNIVTLKLLTLTAPLFIGCLMFGYLKNLFTQWLSLIISSVLTYLFLGLVLQMSIAFLNKEIISITENAETKLPNIFGVAGTAVLICIATYILAKVSVEIAKAIGQVSIEGVGMASTANSAGQILRGGRATGQTIKQVATSKPVQNGFSKSRNAFMRAMYKYSQHNK